LSQSMLLELCSFQKTTENGAFPEIAHGAAHVLTRHSAWTEAAS
jgi:hypothetical protein